MILCLWQPTKLAKEVAWMNETTCVCFFLLLTHSLTHSWSHFSFHFFAFKSSHYLNANCSFSGLLFWKSIYYWRHSCLHHVWTDYFILFSLIYSLWTKKVANVHYICYKSQNSIHQKCIKDDKGACFTLPLLFFLSFGLLKRYCSVGDYLLWPEY